MGRKRSQPRSHCPISFALEIFGDPWTLLILRDAIYLGKRRYGEFLKSQERIATNILADRLERLIRQGLLSRSVVEVAPGGPFYEPTEKSLTLLPILVEIALWSTRYDPESSLPAAISRRMRADRDGFIRGIRKRVRAGLPGLERPPES